MIATMEQANERPQRRDPTVFAHSCRECGSSNTRVVRTMIIVRYCKCRKCGKTWTQTSSSEG